jgi:universal stress protein A
MFDKILVAVDLLLDPARTLIGRALDVAGESGSLWVCHVVEPQYVQYSIDPTFTGSLTRQMEADAIATAQARLAEICEPFGIPEARQLVKLGRVADCVHAAAEEHGVDTIAIGAYDRTGFRRLLGSTANAVLHDAPVNVLTLHLDGDET